MSVGFVGRIVFAVVGVSLGGVPLALAEQGVAATAKAGESAAPAEGLTIAERGKAPTVAVVVPRVARPAIAWAAKDFVGHVEKMTGVRLPIAEGHAPVGMKAIRVTSAAPEATYDGFTVRADADGIAIAGDDDRGAAYGLFELLERFGGCGWYSKTYSHVPTVERFAVPAGYADRQQGAFESRESFWYDINKNGPLAFHLRTNARSWQKNPAEYGGSPHRFGARLGSCHTFETLLPSKTYYRDHPEYYALTSGKRSNSQICLTNPDALRIVTSNFLAAIASDPEARYFGVSQNDNRGFCTCEKCKAVDDEEGSHAGTVIRFVNAVADEVKKAYPDKIVETLAYEYSRKPPKNVRPRDNVMICLCSIECDFAHPLATGAYPQNASFRDDIVGWGKIAKKLYVWDYVTDFAHYLYPFPNEGVFADNLRFFRDHGVKMMFEQGNMTGRHGDMAELKQWLLAKLLWNPEADVRALTERFLKDYYGAGAPFIAEYLGFRARNAAQDMNLWIYEDAASKRYTPAGLDAAAQLWRKAEAAAKDDPERLYNVRMGSLAVDYARIRHLIAGGCKLFGVAETKPDFARLRELSKRFVAIVKESRGGAVALCENTADAARTLEMIEKLAHREGNDIAEVGEETCVRLVARNWGKYVDDPLAQDGKALMVKSGICVWSAQMAMKDVAYVPGKQHVLGVRVRVPPSAAADPEKDAFTFGIHDPGLKDWRLRRNRAVKLSETSGTDYRWYELKAFVPSDGQSFWLQPGKYGKGRPVSEGIFIDAVRLRLATPAEIAEVDLTPKANGKPETGKARL